MDAPTLVTVSRTASGWHAVVAGHGFLAAGSLQTLDRRIRALAAKAPVAYLFQTGNEDLDRLVRRLQIVRAAAQRYDDEARRLVDQVLRLPGFSQRDMGVLVGLSHQRVYQLRARQRQPRGATRRQRPYAVDPTAMMEDDDGDFCAQASGVVRLDRV